MLDRLEELEQEALDGLAAAADAATLAAWRSAYLGHKGALTAALRLISSLPPEDRPAAGQHANQLKQRMQVAFEAAEAMLRVVVEGPPLDVSLPGRLLDAGRLHPVTEIMRRMRSAFALMGFQVYEGRDVESEEYNFTREGGQNHESTDQVAQRLCRHNGGIR
ncbi:MAG: hypothetical protein ACP5JJ_14730 [Anaerolineae bacterium]